jgi:hypothetical protein
LYLWFFCRYLSGTGPPQSTAEQRRSGLRANRVSNLAWFWGLVAGVLGIVALVLVPRLAKSIRRTSQAAAA